MIIVIILVIRITIIMIIIIITMILVIIPIILSLIILRTSPSTGAPPPLCAPDAPDAYLLQYIVSYHIIA